MGGPSQLLPAGCNRQTETDLQTLLDQGRLDARKGETGQFSLMSMLNALANGGGE
ncbi:hypothetical protein [Pararhizobium sp. A13]|uniref:hypothetical protein n=1 Tax=Pararhizobium sp. A13 TaxID=3133975 RepID=UPI00311AC4C2